MIIYHCTVCGVQSLQPGEKFQHMPSIVKNKIVGHKRNSYNQVVPVMTPDEDSINFHSTIPLVSVG